VPNYGVAEALSIIPAAELSEQISTAGTEASGTGNMKLALNGALTIGTLDGANIEIRDAVGPENFFMFGLDVPGVERRRRAGYDPRAELAADVELARAVELIGSGFFSPDQPDRFRPLVDSLLHDDRFLVLADFADYRRAQAEVDTLYRDQEEWTRRAILNVAAMGRFSSDRAVRDYAERIWRVSPDAPVASERVPQERELIASG
jgi:starch phosphorylase